MPLQNGLPVIDADAHVIETEHTWDYLEPSERKFRPLLYSRSDNPGRQYWVIEGKTFPSMSLHGFTIFSLPESAGAKRKDVTTASQTLADVGARIADLDRLGIDIPRSGGTIPF